MYRLNTKKTIFHLLDQVAAPAGGQPQQEEQHQQKQQQRKKKKRNRNRSRKHNNRTNDKTGNDDDDKNEVRISTGNGPDEEVTLCQLMNICDKMPNPTEEQPIRYKFQRFLRN